MESKKNFFQRAFPEFDDMESEKKDNFILLLFIIVLYFIFSMIIFNLKRDSWMIIIPWLPIPIVIFYFVIKSLNSGKIFTLRRSLGFYSVGKEISFKKNPIIFIFQISFEIILASLITVGLIFIIISHLF